MHFENKYHSTIFHRAAREQQRKITMLTKKLSEVEEATLILSNVDDEIEEDIRTSLVKIGGWLRGAYMKKRERLVRKLQGVLKKRPDKGSK